MAIRYAVATGNWSNVATWDGGAALPVAGDDVYANGFDVAVNQDIEVTKISTEVCPTTSVGGGRFTSGGFNIVANVVAGISACLWFGTACLVIGNVYGGTALNAFGLNCGSASPTIIGNIYGGIGTNSYGVVCSTGRLTATGNIYAGSGGQGYRCAAGSSTSHIIGNVFSNLQFGIFYVGILNFTGVATSSASANAIYAFSDSDICVFQGTLINNNGYSAVTRGRIFITPSTSTVWTIQDTDNNDIILYTADAFDQPDEVDVREGTEYGSSVYTGTLAVPPPTSVVKNVPVDDTVGTWEFDDDVIQRLLNCSTVAITGHQIASYNGAPAELLLAGEIDGGSATDVYLNTIDGGGA